MSVDVPAIEAEIAGLRAQVREIQERICHLERYTEQPSVTPVLVYWRYYRERRKPADLWNPDREPIEDAYRQLEAMSNEGQCLPVGVEVNGVLVPQDELYERYGPVD